MAFSLLLRRNFSILRIWRPPPDMGPVESMIYNSRNLTELVRMFKKSSDIDWFRAKVELYEETVRRLAAAKRFGWIEEILEHQKKYRDMSKEGFAVRLITLYGKAGMFEQAYKTFDEMPERHCDRTEMSFNAILEACVNAKSFDKLEELFRELPSKLCVKPTRVSYSVVMKGFCEMGSFDSAVSMLDEMENNGIEPDYIAFNTLLAGLYRNGRFEDGETIWARLEAANVIPDIRSYNSKLSGLTGDKRMSEAVSLVEEMETKGIKVDMFSFNILIKGFCDAGDLEGAKRWYDKLKKSGRTPHQITFWTLIPAACEKGDLDLVLELCKDIFEYRCRVGGRILQQVVDLFVKESKVEEAVKILEKSSDIIQYRLKMPSH